MNTDEKQPESQASEAQEAEESTTEAETSKEESSNDVDYQKELEMAQSELAKKDKRINQAEHVIEKLKSEGTDVNADSIKDMVQQMVQEEVQVFQNKVREDAVDSLVTQYAANPDEAKLIKFHLENSIKPSGDDIDDIINAKALANKARFKQQSSEVKRAQAESEADKASSAGEKQAGEAPQKFSAEELKIMRAYGVSKEDLEKGVR